MFVSILISLEVTLVHLAFKITFIISSLGFNPCFPRSYTCTIYPMKYLSLLYKVSILVFLEVTLVLVQSQLYLFQYFYQSYSFFKILITIFSTAFPLDFDVPTTTYMLVLSITSLSTLLFSK